VVKHAETALRPGGILLSYLPTILQVSTLRETLAESVFGMAETVEILQRGWNVDGASVRPDHRMVAHTGFLITARRLAPGAVLPQRKGRGNKTSYGDEDLEAWTPGAVGDREITDKNLRKRVRDAQRAAEGARTAAAGATASEGDGEYA
jgi:tRNA (adenine57-N1/adenine58-N1)-methyltransferase